MQIYHALNIRKIRKYLRVLAVMSCLFTCKVNGHYLEEKKVVLLVIQSSGTIKRNRCTKIGAIMKCKEVAL